MNKPVFAMTIVVNGEEFPVCIHHAELDESTSNRVHKALIEACKQTPDHYLELPAVVTIREMPQL